MSCLKVGKIRINTICLPLDIAAEETWEYETVIVAGWGYTKVEWQYGNYGTYEGGKNIFYL